MESIIISLLILNLVIGAMNIKTILEAKKSTEKIILDEVAFRENRLNEKLNIVLDKQDGVNKEVRKTIVQQMVIPPRVYMRR